MADEKQLHGEHDMSRKAEGVTNKGEQSGNIGEAAREAQSLDYLVPGEVANKLAEHLRMNPEIIDLKNPHDLYPGAK